MFSKFFHLVSRNHRAAHGLISADSSRWPRAWLTTVYKIYRSAVRTPLSRTPLPPVTLFDTLRMRSSGRSFAADPLSADEIAQLFLYSCGLRSNFAESTAEGRTQPSAGGLYPIEAYLMQFRAGELPAGVYHYNVKEHVLETIEQRDFSANEIAALFVESSAPNAPPRFAHDAACAVVLTAVFDRVQNKYGERGYRYCLLEAGHIAQNLALVSTALGLTCTTLGGIVDEAIDRTVRVDGDEESVVYCALVGRRA